LVVLESVGLKHPTEVTSKLSPRLLQQMLLEKFINDLLNSLKATESPGPFFILEDKVRTLECHLK